EGGVDLVRADEERRGEAKDIRAGGEAHEAGVEGGVDDLSRGAVEDRAHEQTGAARLGHAGKLLEAVEQAVAVRADGREELIVDRRAHGDGGGAPDGIA